MSLFDARMGLRSVLEDDVVLWNRPQVKKFEEGKLGLHEGEVSASPLYVAC